MTESHSRLSPDELLAYLKAEEEQKGRGKLKIFLGYAAGVGKTFAMLEAARQRQKETDVVIAFVETHHRVETEALVNGFEIIPRRQIEYHGITLSEMDIDAVLARRPKLAIVDELAHDNAPGSRHPKRYQDVEELLAAGIDVYTTLNVQHIESGRNVVAQVTNVWVRETVPDTFIDNATEIEIVDLPPDELLKRLQEGKVYVSEQIAPAIDKFFRKGNLTALRELTMRTAARHVDEQSLEYMKTHAITGPWSAGERLLVCIGKGSSGTRLIRSARRLASQAGTDWFAVLIETPEYSRLTPEQQDQIADSLRLAQRLGAKTATIQSDSVAAGVVEYAKNNNITKIIIAKPQSKPFWGSTVVEQIIRLGGQIDIFLVSGGAEHKERFRKPVVVRLGSWQGYLEGLGLVAVASLLGELVHQLISPTTLVMLYLLCVIVTAVWIGLGPSILVSLVSVVVFDLFFIPPVLSFAVSDTQYIFTFLVLLFVGFMASYLTSRVRQQTESVRRKERQTAALYALGRDLAVSNDLQSYVQAIVRRAGETFERKAVVYLPDAQNKDKLLPYGDNQAALLMKMNLPPRCGRSSIKKLSGSGLTLFLVLKPDILRWLPSGVLLAFYHCRQSNRDAS